jgi:uncharacterized protein (TIGR03435 family)
MEWRDFMRLTALILIFWSICFGAAISPLFSQNQPAKPLFFEVATVKRSTSESGPMAIRRTPGQFSTSNTSLRFLIRWAYDVDEYRLVGTPSGLDSTAFDILAKIPKEEKSIPGQTLRLMMQSLLSERFNLRVHRETRELSSYTLVVDKDGPKVNFVDLGEGIGQNPFSMTDRGHLAGKKVTADMLAKVLSDQLHRPVEDATGLKKPFDFVLDWMPESADLAAIQGAPPAWENAANHPTIFTAIREQLGFRLNSRKSMVEVIVIDHVDKMPTDN